MHNAALRACGLTSWRYSRLPLPPEVFAETARALPGAGFRGINVTIPHKTAALTLADSATERARAIGAANTLIFDRGEIWADNTDAPALIAALPWGIAGRTAQVLGAGGSARAAVWALLDGGAEEVRIWNRTPARTRELCDELGGGVPTEEIGPANLLVHCTPLGLDGGSAFKRLPLRADEIERYECVIDFVYTSAGTDLVHAARAHSVPAIDGLELLVGQGALSFEQFTGRAAPLGVMREAVGL